MTSRIPYFDRAFRSNCRKIQNRVRCQILLFSMSLEIFHFLFFFEIFIERIRNKIRLLEFHISIERFDRIVERFKIMFDAKSYYFLRFSKFFTLLFWDFYRTNWGQNTTSRIIYFDRAFRSSCRKIQNHILCQILLFSTSFEIFHFLFFFKILIEWIRNKIRLLEFHISIERFDRIIERFKIVFVAKFYYFLYLLKFFTSSPFLRF